MKQPTKQTQPAYVNISPEEAKRIMDSQNGYVILDVREQNEYDESHIPGAILIPHGQIKELAPSMLPDKDQLILVYCRSGRRSSSCLRRVRRRRHVRRGVLDSVA